MSTQSGNEACEVELLKLIGLFNDAMSIMEHLDESNRPALVETCKSIIKSFQTLHELEPTITGSVPYDLIEQIDKGSNPDDYSRKMVEESQQSERRVAAKQRWMQAFQNSLDQLITQNGLNE